MVMQLAKFKLREIHFPEDEVVQFYQQINIKRIIQKSLSIKIDLRDSSTKFNVLKW